MLADAQRKREDLLKESERVRHDLTLKKNDGEILKNKNHELKLEVERLESYASQLRQNLDDMMQDYNRQFEVLTI